MTVQWAAQLPLGSAAAAATLRAHAGVEAMREGDTLWLRGGELTDDVSNTLRLIPGLTRYTTDTVGMLTPTGKRIPVARLPGGEWTPLRSMISIVPQSPALPARSGERVKLSIVRGGQESAAGAMLLPFAAWHDYAVIAANIRLTLLRFATCADGRTLLIGSPLPPLAGEFFADHNGILVPAGHGWLPHVEPALLRQVLKLDDGDVALLSSTGSHEVIHAPFLLPANRTNVRQTAATLRASVSA